MPNCTYCGSWDGDTADHLVPCTNTAVARPRGKSFKASHGETVPACRECNGLLGTVQLFTVQQRAAFLLGAYQPRYKKLLKTPDWDADDLEDMGPSMKSLILQSHVAKAEVQRKLAHLAVHLQEPEDA